MLPCFVLEEVTLREPGESAALDLGGAFPQDLTLTLRITHAVERSTLHLDVLGSEDGQKWHRKPLAAFAAKNYCGSYEAHCFDNRFRYWKAVWRVTGGAKDGAKPLFELSLSVSRPQMKAMAGAA